MTQIFLVSGTSFDFSASASDWNDTTNTIEGIGGGQAGDRSQGDGGGAFTKGGVGGIGATYAKISNEADAATTQAYVIGAGGTSPLGNGGNTSWRASPTLLARGGGQSTSNVGTVINAGGTGGTVSGCPLGRGGGGGGGAGAPSGAGKNGGAGEAADPGGGGGGGGAGAASATNGSAGSGGVGGAGGKAQDNTAGGTAGNNGSHGSGGGGGSGGTGSGNGGNGIEWDATHGGGGGGGGGGYDSAGLGFHAGGTGGNYGGGGGGGSGGNACASRLAGGAGGPGLIVLTYTSNAFVWQQEGYDVPAYIFRKTEMVAYRVIAAAQAFVRKLLPLTSE